MFAKNPNRSKNYHTEAVSGGFHLLFTVTSTIPLRLELISKANIHDQSVPTKLYTTITVYTTRDIIGKDKILQDSIPVGCVLLACQPYGSGQRIGRGGDKVLRGVMVLWGMDLRGYGPRGERGIWFWKGVRS